MKFCCKNTPRNFRDSQDAHLLIQLSLVRFPAGSHGIVNVVGVGISHDYCGSVSGEGNVQSVTVNS